MATQHCVLEAAGVWVDAGEGQAETCCADSEPRCEHDGCGVVEGGSVVSASATGKVPAPFLQAVFAVSLPRFHDPITLESPPSAAATGQDPSEEWVPRRHMTRRAVLPARAP